MQALCALTRAREQERKIRELEELEERAAKLERRAPDHATECRHPAMDHRHPPGSYPSFSRRSPASRERATNMSLAHPGGEYNANLLRVDASSGSPALHEAQV